MVEEWIKECRDSNVVSFFDGKEIVYIYKGFRLTSSSVMDVRKSDFYDPVPEAELAIMKNKGFVKGADLIVYKRDFDLCKEIEDEIKFIYKTKKKYKEKLLQSSRKSFYEKKIRNCDKKMRNMVDKLYFFKARRDQVKKKYNIN